MYCRRAPASRPGRAGRTSRTATVVWLPARAGWRIRRAAVLSDHGRGPWACRGQALYTRAGRGAGVGWRAARGQRAPPPLASRGAPRVGRAVFHWPGYMPQIGTPWKAFHGGGGLAGGRRSGAAPLACLWPLRFAVLARPRTVISARSCVQARSAPPSGSPP